MKKRYEIMAGALLLAGALLTGCTTEDNAVENTTVQVAESRTIHFTATLAPKGDNGGDATRSVNASGVTAWVAGEQIAIYYQTGETTYATAIATVGTPNADGSATFTATLSGAIGGGTVQFIYPATLHDGKGGIDESAILNTQRGNLVPRPYNASVNDISTNFDLATYDGTLTVSGNTATVNGAVSMQNQLCICAFRFFVGGSSGFPLAKAFIINDGNGHTYVVSSDILANMQPATGGPSYQAFTAGETIYVAMFPFENKKLSISAISGSNYFSKTTPPGTLAKGKFYSNVSVDLTSGTLEAIGQNLSSYNITASDGDIIYSSGSTAHTLTIAAGATVTLAGVNINTSNETISAGITCGGNANIILVGTNTVTAKHEYHPAIQVGGEGTTLTISGSGSLAATGGKNAAGIGSGYYNTCGNITISCGTVSATGGNYGAGIGSGQCGTCGDITISGGTVSATGFEDGAGIGSGNIGTCGNIRISSGTVSATGNLYATAIGSGYFGKYTSIEIASGITSVTATRVDNKNPIGKGLDDKGSGSVTIDGEVLSDVQLSGDDANLPTFPNLTVTKSANNKTWTITRQ